tara:strand:- start:1228 stop:1416 length:189 start_codon:yes stop_codon:yes gene_type:complete
MFNFSNVILVCGTAAYIMQDDLTSFIVMIILGTISKLVGVTMNIAERNKKSDDKNKIQELIN